MTAAPTGDKPAAASNTAQPRDAATLIIVDRGGSEPKVLMGKRRMEQVFMPGKYVFPGGRVDKTDPLVTSADEMMPAETGKLMLRMRGKPSARRARALGLAAIRETYEEAGLVVGAPVPDGTKPPSIPGWAAFFAHGFMPKLSPLTFFARAITPPGRPRRYDTRFFYMNAEDIALRTDTSDGELSGLHWLTMADARDLDLPPITRVVLEDLMDRIREDTLHAAHALSSKVPFYHHSNGSFRREMLQFEASEP